jgi:hypothetical protein
MAVQWVHLGASGVLVASSRAAWIQAPGLGADWFGEPMPEALPASPEATRRLLDGAIAAAERAAPQVPEPPITARRWAWSLVSQWHTAHHSVELLPLAIDRFHKLGREDLAGFCVLKLEEEQGHDQYPLADLRALGYDAAALVASMPPEPTVTAGLRYARECVLGEAPVQFIGYVYALERRVLRLDDAWFGTLQAVLPGGVDAVSGMRLHANEFDIEHVDEAVAFIAGLAAADRASIAAACHRITGLLCAVSTDQYKSEAELDEWLQAFAVREPQPAV